MKHLNLIDVILESMTAYQPTLAFTRSKSADTHNSITNFYRDHYYKKHGLDFSDETTRKGQPMLLNQASGSRSISNVRSGSLGAFCAYLSHTMNH